jgi:hypothetical protein
MRGTCHSNSLPKFFGGANASGSALLIYACDCKLYVLQKSLRRVFESGGMRKFV